MNTTQRLKDRDRIFGMWHSKTADQRGLTEAENFSDEVWDMGLRLASNTADHRQHVMDLIRNHIK